MVLLNNDGKYRGNTNCNKYKRFCAKKMRKEPPKLCSQPQKPGLHPLKTHPVHITFIVREINFAISDIQRLLAIIAIEQQ